MQLWKAHGLGNDYLVWEGKAKQLTSQRVQKICHRTQGVGSDGILEPCDSVVADFGVRIWNPDGSIAEKSGNGLRIFAHWLHYHQGAPKIFRIDTGDCVVQAHILETDISIDMGVAYWKSSQIPTVQQVWGTKHVFDDQTIVLYAVGVGNPHCVSFFDADQNLDTLPWKDWGAALEDDIRFPNRTNVQFAKVLDRKNIEIRIWERGAGETSASGSSSCAVASVAHKLDWVDGDITMHMPGGILSVQISQQGDIFLIGPVEEIGRILLNDDFFSYV